LIKFHGEVLGYSLCNIPLDCWLTPNLRVVERQGQLAGRGRSLQEQDPQHPVAETHSVALTLHAVFAAHACRRSEGHVGGTSHVSLSFPRLDEQIVVLDGLKRPSVYLIWGEGAAYSTKSPRWGGDDLGARPWEQMTT
jgi:hypothetical protein